jgi:Cys-tRNA(Pro)/Cys-tRNA(Cys) deacylase
MVVVGHHSAMTPAVDQLNRFGIAHRLLVYEHDPTTSSYGTEAAEALGLDPDSVFKTLLAVVSDLRATESRGSMTSLVVGLVPVTGMLDLKELARAAGAKRAVMADPKTAARTTGYVVGGISPFGQRKPLPTFVDETAEILDVMRVSGGRRGLEIELDPQDLVRVLSATVAPLAT